MQEMAHRRRAKHPVASSCTESPADAALDGRSLAAQALGSDWAWDLTLASAAELPKHHEESHAVYMPRKLLPLARENLSVACGRLSIHPSPASVKAPGSASTTL